MHILEEVFRKELVDIYEGKAMTVFRRAEDIFNRVLIYFNGNYDVTDKVDEVRELIDALADWTHNPTESGLRKILDVEEKMSGYGLTPNANEAIAVVAYCITHGIPCEIGVVGEFYKIEFKDITINQRDEIVKAGNNTHFISSRLYPEN